MKTILAGFPDRVARRRARGDDRAVMVGGRGLVLDGCSVVREAMLFCAVDLDAGPRRTASEARVRLASRIEEAWLLELFPDSVREEEAVVFDEALERVVATRRRLYEDLVLDERKGTEVDAAQAEAVLEQALRAHPERVLVEEGSLAAFLVRARCLRTWRPELELPAFDPPRLVDALASLCPGRRSFAELRAAPLLDVLRGGLSHEQRTALEQEAPERILLPSGRHARLRYEEGRPPVLSATAQHLFGLTETPRVAAGRVPCLVEVLAPNRRPVQLTQDLESFWTNTWSQVRKDLRARYPKHAWPERPPGL